MPILSNGFLYSPVMINVTGDFLFETAGWLRSDTQHLHAIPTTDYVTIEFHNKT